MKIHIILLGLVLCVPLMGADKKPLTKEESAKVIEAAIRTSLKKPTGELTTADLVKVTYLDLGYTKITDAGLKEVAKLQQLEEVFFGSTKITDAGLKEVAKMQQLKSLDLIFCTKITDAGLKEVAKMQQLKSLNLVFCPKVTKAVVAELQKALPNCRIASNPRK